MPIPYYDPDHTLIAFVSKNIAERYIAAGTAAPVRSRGEIVRIYRKTRAKVFSNRADSVRSMTSAASLTTTRLNVDGLNISAPIVRQHKRSKQP
jgi:hypothetical protein